MTFLLFLLVQKLNVVILSVLLVEEKSLGYGHFLVMLVEEKSLGIWFVLHSYVHNFYRTPAGYTADRKTRRRNMVWIPIYNYSYRKFIYVSILKPRR